MKRVLTGVKPTSDMLHLGNYVSAIQPLINMQSDPELDIMLFVADYHALTTLKDGNIVRNNTDALLKQYIALGVDPQKVIMFIQSQGPEVCALAYMLACVAPLGLMQRSHAIRAAEAEGKEVNCGTFLYPILMAADILLYSADLVPVGIDQIQHLEIASDLAQKFNHHFGAELKIPKPMLQEKVQKLPGTDGNKMSKSKSNTIDIFAPEKEVKAAIMRIKTDSTPMGEPLNPDICNVFAIYSALASAEQTEALRTEYIAGTIGYGGAKKKLVELFFDKFGEARKRYEEITDDDVNDVICLGTARAYERARDVLAMLSEATGTVC